jgi:hypothetical protein
MDGVLVRWNGGAWLTGLRGLRYARGSRTERSIRSNNGILLHGQSEIIRAELHNRSCYDKWVLPTNQRIDAIRRINGSVTAHRARIHDRTRCDALHKR